MSLTEQIIKKELKEGQRGLCAYCSRPILFRLDGKLKKHKDQCGDSCPNVDKPQTTIHIRPHDANRCDMSEGPCACGTWHYG